MERTHNVRRFRANPIEVAIFSVTVLIFVESAYSLFYDYPEFHLAALSAMKSNPLSEERVPASTSASVPAPGSVPGSAVETSLETLPLDCGKMLEKDTNHGRVRLTGPLCGINEAAAGGTSAGDTFVRLKVTNTANHQEATVFTEPHSGVFSTDYIPLSPGKNPIHLEFSYASGKLLTQDVILNKL